VKVKASDFEVFEALAVDSIGTESAKTSELLPLSWRHIFNNQLSVDLLNEFLSL